MKRATHAFHEEIDDKFASIKRMLKSIEVVRKSREVYNSLPYEIRTIEADYASVMALSSLHVTYRFKDTNDERDELATEIIGKLLSAGTKMNNGYTYFWGTDDGEVWGRDGEIETEKGRCTITVVGFSRPIGYELVEEEEVSTSKVTKAKCNFSTAIPV